MGQSGRISSANKSLGEDYLLWRFASSSADYRGLDRLVHEARPGILTTFHFLRQLIRPEMLGKSGHQATAPLKGRRQEEAKIIAPHLLVTCDWENCRSEKC